MKIGWLIDADMCQGYVDQLVAAVRQHGHEAKVIHSPSPPYRWEDAGLSYRSTFPSEACVVAQGDIGFVTRIVSERRWTPGAFCTIENFFFSSYVCHYGQHLLNGNYAMLPFGELDRCRDFLFDTLGRDGQIFVRPDSPLKLFTGQVASRDKFSADLEFMGFYEFPRSSLVVVSTPKPIVSEWRFVVADHKVVTGCQYKHDGRMDPQPSYDGAARALADKIAALEYAPDPVWVMDICRTEDGACHLLEIGGFSFADLYACNMMDVVPVVASAAIAAWELHQRR